MTLLSQELDNIDIHVHNIYSNFFSTIKFYINAFSYYVICFFRKIT